MGPRKKRKKRVLTITDDDIVAVGGDLSADTLIQAYEVGIFPWPMTELALIPWFSPHVRAVVDFSDLHISRSLAKARKKLGYTCTIDKAFEDVLEGCAEAERPGQDGTWITPDMFKAYLELHARGVAHSVEVWDDHGGLVGGIYGVASKNYFSAESMFYRKDYASKIALLYLIEHLKERGLEWLDIQVMTEHMEKMGAKNISRKEFMGRLKKTPTLELFSPLK